LIVNLPNSITLSRIAMIPLFLWILSPYFPGHGAQQEVCASVLFVLASITDGLDGYLARKRGQITTMGMLLDPLADKIMITSALVALVAWRLLRRHQDELPPEEQPTGEPPMESPAEPLVLSGPDLGR